MSHRRRGTPRPWSFLSVLTVLALALSACGGGAPAGGDNAPAAAADTPAPSGGMGAVGPTATIPRIEGATAVLSRATGVPRIECQPDQREIVWMVRNSPVENRWENSVVRPDFQKAQPEICLNIQSINQPDIAVKRQAIIQAGQPLHVWSPNWGGNGFASDRVEGLLEDLTPLIQADNFDTSVFNAEILKIYQAEGKTYGLPFLTTGSYIYYNQKLLEDAGVETPPTNWDDKTWTWDKVIELSKKLTKNVGDRSNAQYGLGTAVLNLEGPPSMWGNEVWTDEAYETGLSGPIKVTDEKSVASFQALHDAIHVHKVTPDPATTAALDNLGGAFATGRMAMAMSGGWGHWTWAELINDPNGFCWGVAPMPFGSPDAKNRTVIYTDPWSITSDLEDAEKQDAWTFVKFLVSEDQARKYMQSAGVPPTQTKLLGEYYKQFAKCMPEAKMKEVFEGAFTHGRESSNHLLVKWDELDRVWQNNLSSFWNNRNAKALPMLQKIETGTNQALEKIRNETQADQGE